VWASMGNIFLCVHLASGWLPHSKFVSPTRTLAHAIKKSDQGTAHIKRILHDISKFDAHRRAQLSDSVQSHIHLQTPDHECVSRYWHQFRLYIILHNIVSTTCDCHWDFQCGRIFLGDLGHPVDRHATHRDNRNGCK